MPRGSRPGERRGGRQKGTLNKRTVILREAIEKSGLSALAYLQSVYRDENQPHDARRDAAKAAAPFETPRLSSIEHSGGLQVEKRVSAEPLGEKEWASQHTTTAH